MIEPPPQPRKAVAANKRKAATRKARKPGARKVRAALPKAKPNARPGAAACKAIVNSPSQPTMQDTSAAMMTADLLDRALAMQSDPVEVVPAIVPPLPAPAADPLAVGATPLPRARAIAHQRSNALLDVIGYWLRDAGRWLSRWGKVRRKAEARSIVARATARHRALQSQVEALEALREIARAD